MKQISNLKSLFVPQSQHNGSSSFPFKAILSTLFLFVFGYSGVHAQMCNSAPTGSVGNGQVVCTGFSPNVATGALSPSTGTRYRITASTVSGNASGFTPLQTSIGENADIEGLNLRSTSTGIIEYVVIPYCFGSNGVDNGGLGDDISGSPLFVYITVNACPPACVGTAAFTDYQNASPANGIANPPAFPNNDGSNNVTITNTISGGSFSPGRPNWSITSAGIQLSRGSTGGITTTTYSFDNTSSDQTFLVASLETSGSPGSFNYLESVLITGTDGLGNTVYPNFYNLNDGTQIYGTQSNELRDGDGGNQASANFYFLEQVKTVTITQTGSQDNIILTLNGCAFPSDYGDLTQGVWPVASAVVAGILTTNIPDNYDVTNRPGIVAWAGAKISTEPLTINGGSNEANTDDFDDGLVPPMSIVNPSTPTTFTVMVNANRANTKVYYRLWFDWNKNGSFSDDYDYNTTRATYGGSATVLSPNTPISIPVNLTAPLGAVYNYTTRLAVSLDTITDVYAASSSFIMNLTSGEIEDYQSVGILPVKMLQFTAKKQNNSAQLNWKIAEEANVTRYDVEYSPNGISFTTVGSVLANGGPDYTFTHNPNRSYGSGFYRIKSVDKDGRSSYSNTRSINWNGNINVSVSPNPVKNRMQIRVDSYNDTQKMFALITDGTGRTVAKKIITNAISDIDVYNWANGIYQVQLISEDHVVYTQKVVKN